MSLLLLQLRSGLASCLGVDESDVAISGDIVTLPTCSLAGSDVLQRAAGGVPANLSGMTAMHSAVSSSADKCEIAGPRGTVTVQRLRCMDSGIDAGVFALTTADPSERFVVFTGSFGTTVSQPDLSDYPELVLSLALLAPVKQLAGPPSWTALLECLGPLVIFGTSRRDYALAEVGLTVTAAISYRVRTVPVSAQTVREVRSGVPSEAVHAYVQTLCAQDGADVVFLRAFRICELLIAKTAQTEIAAANLAEVYKRIRAIQSSSEHDMVRKVLIGCGGAFATFTKQDFEALFGTHRPARENYTKITKWLDAANANDIPPVDVAASIVYYIRCALVHAKMGDNEPFLFPPFQGASATAIEHLADDLVGWTRTLLFA